ncbi:MAG: hypothetical protein V2B14_04215 [bacterium]
MKNLKNVKFTNKLQKLSSKFKWFLFTEIQDLKLTSDYINFICPGLEKKNSDSLKNLENLVKQSIIREFSPEIENLKSFDLLVNAITHRIQCKSLERD